MFKKKQTVWNLLFCVQGIGAQNVVPTRKKKSDFAHHPACQHEQKMELEGIQHTVELNLSIQVSGREDQKISSTTTRNYKYIIYIYEKKEKKTYSCAQLMGPLEYLNNVCVYVARVGDGSEALSTTWKHFNNG